MFEGRHRSREPGSVDDVILRVGRFDLIVGEDRKDFTVDVRPFVVYELSGASSRFIGSQTDPPILKSMCGSVMEASFLREEWDGRITRYAFKVEPLRILDYRLSGGSYVRAVEFYYFNSLYRREVRFFYRVEPPSEFSVVLEIEGYDPPVSVINISGGGIAISFKRDSSLSRLRPGDRVKGKLYMEEVGTVDVILEVVRKFRKPEFETIEFIGFKFVDMQDKDRELVVSFVRKVERTILKRRAGLI